MTTERIRKAEAGPLTTVTTDVPFLSTELWADIGTIVPLAQQSGSIAAPFASLATALAALPAFSVLNIAPGDYTVQPPIVLTTSIIWLMGAWTNWAPGANVAVGWTFLSPGLPNITGPGVFVGLANLTVDQLSADDISLINCYVSSILATTNGDLRAEESLLPSNISSSGQVTCDGCHIGFGGAASISAGGLVVRLSNCRINSGPLTVTFTGAAGVLQVDESTNFFLNQFGGVNVVNGTLVVTGRAARETISVVVPAVLAGQVGYVSTVMVGELAAIPQFEPVVGNPQVDLVAAGAGGGFVNCWADVAGSIRCSFVGPLAGGAANFTFATV